MDFENDPKTLSPSEALSENGSNGSAPQRKYVSDPYISHNNHEIGKAEMFNFLCWISSLKFRGKSGASDKQVLIEIIENCLDYVVGKSAVHPGVRKISTNTNRHISTVAKSYTRLERAGWITITSKGNRSGKATTVRPNFENPPQPMPEIDSLIQHLHPLTYQQQWLWTGFALGENSRLILNCLYETSLIQAKSPQLIKADICRITGIQYIQMQKALDLLVDFNLVQCDGRRYSAKAHSQQQLNQCVNDIADYFSVESRMSLKLDRYESERKVQQAIRQSVYLASIGVTKDC